MRMPSEHVLPLGVQRHRPDELEAEVVVRDAPEVQHPQPVPRAALAPELGPVAVGARVQRGDRGDGGVPRPARRQQPPAAEPDDRAGDREPEEVVDHREEEGVHRDLAARRLGVLRLDDERGFSGGRCRLGGAVSRRGLGWHLSQRRRADGSACVRRLAVTALRARRRTGWHARTAVTARFPA